MKINIATMVPIIAATACLTAGSPLLASETDDQIKAAASSSYVFKTFLKDDSVKVESEDGAVTLTGTVSQPSHKSLAGDTVEALPSVKSVDNQLELSKESQEEHADMMLARKVKTLLRLHHNVNGNATEVSAEDEVVTLKGIAASEAAKDLTTEYAEDVAGVKKVHNKMTIAEAKDGESRTILGAIDDASISAQIKGSLLTHGSTSALHTGIKTHEGAVTVSGIASNDAEKNLVTKLIRDINGVVSVTNNMSISQR